ncbi:porin [Croceibacterium mercuriale]|uniref:Porin n=1 Tax=Croceibacterium mercuriale TaxID=1572751 RepID=A0A0B2C0E6_9SPHN|nr:porin [Croceibacterium mercuriale]KHL25471.1 porin [Croceibacterium mercuriale]
MAAHRLHLIALAATAISIAAPVRAQSVADLQRQIDALKAQVEALQQALQAPEQPAAAVASATPAPPTAPPVQPATGQVEAGVPDLPVLAETLPSGGVAQPPTDSWFERLQLRGYTQLRYNGVLDGDVTAPAGQSRLRSVHDSSINADGGFSLRRVRLVLQGDVTDNIELYLQHDFGTAVNSQSSAEPRQGFGQLRDAYVDVFLDRERSFRLRFGQSKVPLGWENLQSSSNRIPLDRSDAINSAVPGERDLGVTAYYTPPHVQRIWDRLAEDGQKLFGNYGAFGVGLYNGQGTNRVERNDSLMKVAMATWPFALDGLGPLFRGQVLELGGSAMLNRFRPEVRTGGVSAVDYREDRIGLHAILYPQPFGIQAEWVWGQGPQFDTATQRITEAPLEGGYVQLTYDLGETGIGRIRPYGRWQRYRGGWKAATNAPRLETDEIELGLEWPFMDALELTVAYARMKRREADERRLGQAEGDLIRTQLQWSY